MNVFLHHFSASQSKLELWFGKSGIKQKLGHCKTELIFQEVEILFFHGWNNKYSCEHFHTVLFFLTYPDKDNSTFIFQTFPRRCRNPGIMYSNHSTGNKCFIVFFFFLCSRVLLLSFFLRRASFLELLSNVLTQ